MVSPDGGGGPDGGGWWYQIRLLALPCGVVLPPGEAKESQLNTGGCGS